MPALRTSFLALAAVCAVSTGTAAQTIQVDTDFGDQGWMDTGFSQRGKDLQVITDRSSNIIQLRLYHYSHPGEYLVATRRTADGARISDASIGMPPRDVTGTPLGRMVVDDENRLTVVGSLTRTGLGRMAFISRLLQSGYPDLTLAGTGHRIIDLPTSAEVITAIQDSNRVLFAYSQNGITGGGMVALLPDGSFDPSFQLNPSTSTKASTENNTSNPQIVDIFNINNKYVVSSNRLLQGLNHNGRRDVSFGLQYGNTDFGISDGDFYLSTLTQWGNRIVAGGTYCYREEEGIALFVFTENGILDPTFNGGATVFFEPTAGRPSGHTGVGAENSRIGLTTLHGNLVATLSTQIDSLTYGLNFVAFDASGAQIDLGGPLGFHVEPVTRYYTQHLPQYYSSTGAVIVNDNRLVVSGTTRTAYLGVSRLDAYRLTGFPVSSATPAEPERLDLVVAPSPTSRSARATLTLPQPQRVRIAVVDMLGRTVLSVADQETPAGTHTVPLDVSRLAPGAYVVVAATGTGRQTARLSVVR